jgi:hypothetical protein
VKRLKALGTTTNLSNPAEQRMLKRDQLGETFGTRKAKSRIKAVERNKVDAEAQAGVKDHLLSSIELASQNIPSAGESPAIASEQGLGRHLLKTLCMSRSVRTDGQYGKPTSFPEYGDHGPGTSLPS